MDSDDEVLDLFNEPEGYYQKEREATQAEHRTLNGQLLTLRLVGQSPLWGHLLWQGGRTVADFLEANKQELIQDKSVLELGAGAGLPSIICAINGAKLVVVTDYPDAELIDNLRVNARNCVGKQDHTTIHATGYLWGAETSQMKTHLPKDERGAGFDLLILADLLFNHSEHRKLLSSVQQLLKRESTSQALVFFTPYRPWLLDKDLAFFDLATECGLVVEKILEKLMEKVMFEDDRGDEQVRRTVFGYRLTWSEGKLTHSETMGGSHVR